MRGATPKHVVNVGDTFGHWLVLEVGLRKPDRADARSKDGIRKGDRAVLARDGKCGRTFLVTVSSLVSGGSTQCPSCSGKERWYRVWKHA